MEGTTAVGKSLETTGVFLLRPSGWNLKTLPGTSWASCRQRLQCLPSVVDRTLPSMVLGMPDHSYRVVSLPHLLRHFSFGQSISLLLSPCSLLTCKAYGVQSLQVPSSIHRTPSHTHTTASCRYLFLDGWNVICMRMLVVWNMTFIFPHIYIY